MIKSIFVKYILAFLAIITISFSILAGLISAHIIRYSNETQQISMANAANAARQYIEDSAHYDLPSLSGNLAVYLEFAEDSFIFITDNAGQIILTAPAPLPENYLNRDYVSESLMREVSRSFMHYRFDTLDGLFSAGHQVFTQPLTDENGELFGVLFFCSSSSSASAFANQVINTIILSCLWVLIATLVIMYFMTEKVISPVRAMSRAAKSFATGKFDVRVPVRGGDEVAELAAAFNNMAAALSVNEETERMFLANASHDLRTPMQTIGGFINGILDGTIPESEHKYYLNIVASETDRLARLVTNIFEITRLQAGERKINKVNFDICEAVRLALIILEPQIEAKNIEVEFLCDEDKIQVYADSGDIRRVLQNLCENAVKFTPEGGLIRIKIYEQEKKAHVSVFNTGEGIIPEDIPIIFNRFYKSDRSRGLDSSGVGLGLFITKTIIDGHEESLQVKSEYGKNCEFIFTLRKSNEIKRKT